MKKYYIVQTVTTPPTYYACHLQDECIFAQNKDAAYQFPTVFLATQFASKLSSTFQCEVVTV